MSKRAWLKRQKQIVGKGGNKLSLSVYDEKQICH
jgi:hypothetical protein